MNLNEELQAGENTSLPKSLKFASVFWHFLEENYSVALGVKIHAPKI